MPVKPSSGGAIVLGSDYTHKTNYPSWQGTTRPVVPYFFPKSTVLSPQQYKKTSNCFCVGTRIQTPLLASKPRMVVSGYENHVLSSKLINWCSFVIELFLIGRF